MKAQFMSIAALVLVALMVTELFIFVIIVVGYNNLFQSAALTATSNGYGSSISQTAGPFAKSALSSAMSALFVYEYNASYRGGNFITNMSNSIASLIQFGNLPNVPSTSPAGKMFLSYMSSNLISYNAMIVNSTGFGSKNVIINETTPIITQYSPYSISVRYVENVQLNSSGGVYIYHIPVNVSVSLNNTLDLYAAEEGLIRPIKFVNASSSTSVVANAYAIAGNNMQYAYGTVYYVPGTPTCATLGLPASYTAAIESGIIIATPNAFDIGHGCSNSFAGWITQVINTSTPSVPWLEYATAGVANSLVTGQKVLLYGPGLETLGIEQLKNNILGGYYMASSFSPSYIQKVQGNLTAHSQYGLFNFPIPSISVASFNGYRGGTANTVVTAPDEVPIHSLGNVTVSAWVYIPPGNVETAGSGVACKGLGGGSEVFCLDFFPSETASACDTSSPPAGQTYPTFFIQAPVGGAHTYCAQATKAALSTGNWHLLTGSFSWNGSVGVGKLYEDGEIANVFTEASSSVLPFSASNFSMGNRQSSTGLYVNTFNGLLSNVQLYKVALTPQQIWSLYQEGITGIPIPGNALVGWWTLNGNPNDLSGFSNPTKALGQPNLLASPLNYTRDSIFLVPQQSKAYPLPGVLNCDNVAECSSSTIPHLYLGTNPLETGANLLKVARFNGEQIASATVLTQNTISRLNTNLQWPYGKNISVSMWINPTNTLAQAQGIISSKPGNIATVGGLEINMTGGGTGSSNCRVDVLVQTAGTGGAPVQHTFQSSACIAPNKWNHLVVEVIQKASGGNSTNIYINETPDLSFTSLTGNSMQAFGGFNISYGGSNAFAGNISNVQVYNYTLSQLQVNALYQEGIAGLPLQGPGLQGWWPLNGNPDDYSGRGDNGTMYNVGFVPVFSGNYAVPGLNQITVSEDEWQSFGLTDPH